MFHISHRLYSISVAYGLPRIGQIYVRGNAGLRDGLARGDRLSLTALFPVPGGQGLGTRTGPDRARFRPRYARIPAGLEGYAAVAAGDGLLPSLVVPARLPPAATAGVEHQMWAGCQRSPTFLEHVGQALQPCARSTFSAMVICCERVARSAVPA